MLSSGDLLQLHGLKERYERMRLHMLQVILAKRTIVKLIHTVQLTGSSAWSSEAQSRYSSTVGQMVKRYNFKNVKKYKTQGNFIHQPPRRCWRHWAMILELRLCSLCWMKGKFPEDSSDARSSPEAKRFISEKKMIRTCLPHWVPIHVEDRPGKNGLLFLDRGAWRALMHILTVNIHSF